MSFGGSVAAMISSLKNNRRQLREISDKDDILKTVPSSKNKQPLKYANKLSPEEFQALSERLSKGKRKSIITQSIVYGVIFLGALYLAFFWL